jgi:DNA-binding transcriptional MerR regulator
MSSNAEPLLTVDELAARAGVPVRTVRFYIAEGLLPGASARGKGPSYTQEHLDRLQLIRLLVARHLPLSEVRELVTRLPPGEVRDVVQEEQERTEEIAVQASKPASPKEYLSVLLDQARGFPGQGTVAGAVGPGVHHTRQRETSLSWHRWEIAPGIELQVRADVAQAEQEVIERVLDAIRAVLTQTTTDRVNNQLPQEE